MRAISAADSVSLAFQRTRDFLFRPFAWGTYLKLGLVAVLTEGIGTNTDISRHARSASRPGSGPSVPPDFHLKPEWIVVIIVTALIVALVSLIVFYLVTRLRFAFFHCLVRNSTQIKPGWRLYREQASRFFWLNVVVGICSLLLIAIVALPFVAGFWRVYRQIASGGEPPVALILSLVLPLIPIVLLLLLAAVAVNLILRDFMLPHFALDNATAGEAFSRAWASIKAEKLQFFVYTLFRVILPAVALIGLFFVLLIPGLFLAGAGAAVEYSLHSVFSSATGAAWVVGIVVQVFFGLIAFAFAVLASICLGGPLSTGLREYALIFYGGRYPALGDLLYPPPTAVMGAPGD